MYFLSTSWHREPSLHSGPGSDGTGADPSMACRGRAWQQHSRSFRAGSAEAAVDAQQPAPSGAPSHQHSFHWLLHAGWCSQHAAEEWWAATATAPAASSPSSQWQQSPVASSHLLFCLPLTWLPKTQSRTSDFASLTLKILTRKYFLFCDTD